MSNTFKNSIRFFLGNYYNTFCWTFYTNFTIREQQCWFFCFSFPILTTSGVTIIFYFQSLHSLKFVLLKKHIFTFLQLFSMSPGWEGKKLFIGVTRGRGGLTDGTKAFLIDILLTLTTFFRNFQANALFDYKFDTPLNILLFLVFLPFKESKLYKNTCRRLVFLKNIMCI